MRNVLGRLRCFLFDHKWILRPDIGADDERVYDCMRCPERRKARPAGGNRGVAWTDQQAAAERTDEDDDE